MLKKLYNKIFACYAKHRFLSRNKSCNIHRSTRFQCIQNIVIGDNCNIGMNSNLLCWEQYLHAGQIQHVNGQIEIGRNLNATRNLTIQSCGKVKIGDDVLIASNVFICDYNHGMNPDAASYLENELDIKRTDIGDGVWIGQNAIILGGVSIGRKSIIAAGAVVTKSIPPYCVVAGNPAHIIKCYDLDRGEWVKEGIV